MPKVYTAHEMRVLADRIWDYETMSKGLELCDNELEQVDCEATHDLIHMLRQAADALEELDELKNNHLKKVEAALRRANLIGMDCDREIARLKAQLADAKIENKAIRAWICPSDVGEWIRHPCKWGDGLKFPWHETVNPSALKGTRYEWSQYADGRHVGLCDWLSLYRAEPHVETLAKLGLDVLITPYAIKSLKTAKVREWVLAHAAEIKRCGSVKEILWAAKHNSTLKAAHNRFRFVDEMTRRWRGDYYGHYYGYDPDVKIPKVRFDYDRLMKLVAKWHVGVDEYVRYLQEATRAHRDLTNEGTLYPPTAGGRDAFIARTEELEREGDRYETAARRRKLRAERAERKREEERMASLMAERAPEIERFQKSLDRSKVLHGCGYKLVLAKSQKELVAEGKRMHNCVGCGTYGEGLVVGRCLILTIAAGKSRYCVEIDRKSWTVRQCYAKHNEAAPEEIRDLAKSVAGIIKSEFKKIKAKKAA